MSKRKKAGTSSGVAPSSGEVDRHLNTFECHEISRLYKHLINVTQGESLLVTEKYELAAKSLSSLLKKLAHIRTLSVQAADDHTLHGECDVLNFYWYFLAVTCPHHIIISAVFSVQPFTSLHELVLNRVPPSTVEDIYSFRGQIYRLEVVNSGIPELIKLLAPIKQKYWGHFKPMLMGVADEAAVCRPGGQSEGDKVSDTASRTSANTSTDTDPSTSLYQQHSWGRLTHLRLCNCGLARLDPSLHFLPRLRSLDLSHNSLHHITHLHDCSELSLLNLAYNRIRVLSNLHLVVGNVQKLNLSHNQIAMLDGVAQLKHLVKLDLSHNLIDDVSELEPLTELEGLRELILAGNPLACSRHTAGVTVAQETAYRCSVLGVFMHDCSLQGREVPGLDGVRMSTVEEATIK